jgi:AraC-like DNA-binding protein
MKENIHLLNWQVEIEDAKVVSIENDLILLEKPIIKSTFDYPFKVDVTTTFICLSGKMEGYINLKPIIASAPSLTVIFPSQILQYKYISDDFTGLFTVMSNQFINNLNIQKWTPLFTSIRENPVVSLTKDDLKPIITYYSLLKDAIKREDNPYRMETVRYLTKAFFYGAGNQFHKVPESDNKSKHEILVDKFLKLVEKHYRVERGLGFYADKLSMTSKYLSALVKTNTGKFANEWIDSYVILEAEALLKSTNMTIQQISDELNFPTQSVFGKYFKRLTGKSPKEYKNK